MVVASRSEPSRFAQQLFGGLPQRYDALAEVLSMGQNRRWRAAMVAKMPALPAGRVLDVATGPARVALALHAATGARVVGLDLTPEMLERASSNLVRRGRAGRVVLVQGRGEQLPFPDATFDGLTFTYLLRYVSDPAATLAEVARVVRPGGVVANLEFAVPPSPLWHAAWWAFTRAILPACGAALGGRPWYEVGRFLGPSISEHYRQYPLPWTVEAWRSAGLVDVGTRTMSLGGGLVMWARRAGGTA
ncbi:MAG: class I SAM-dependent methyltransferase [Acidimicrobiales bacterium]